MLQQGRKVPEPFLDQPELLPVSAFYWQAFLDLATERPVGMSIGAIPRSRVVEYASHEGIVDPDEFDRFWWIISRLDTEQLRLVQADIKKNSGKHEQRASASDPKGMRNVMTSLKQKSLK